MRIWGGEQREEGECRPTKMTTPASNPNPVVVLIVRLLATVAVTDDGIAFTQRASSQQALLAVARPVAFDLARRGRKWDKNNRVV